MKVQVQPWDHLKENNKPSYILVAMPAKCKKYDLNHPLRNFNSLQMIKRRPLQLKVCFSSGKKIEVTKSVIIWLILALWENERKKSQPYLHLHMHTRGVFDKSIALISRVSIILIPTNKIIQIGPLDSLQAKINKEKDK